MSEAVPLWDREFDPVSGDGTPCGDVGPPQVQPGEQTTLASDRIEEIRERPSSGQVKSSNRPRLLSLDIIRGLAVVGMILVNNPGEAELQPSWLAHAKWDGLSLGDFVFPFFLFSVGMALALTLGRYRSREGMPRVFRRLLRRSIILVALGLVFHLLMAGDLSTFRIPGVFQRIGVCFFLAGLIVLTMSWKWIALAGGMLLGGYALLLIALHPPSFARPDQYAGWPVTELPFASVEPQSGPSYLSMAGSLPSYVDRCLFGRHLYRPEYDPEGFLSTFPAIVTVLIGALAGLWLQTDRGRKKKLQGLFLAGFILTSLGGVVSIAFPINKSLWSPSFVLVTGGSALLLLALCEGGTALHPRAARWLRPVEVFGANALAAYLGSNLVMVVFSNGRWAGSSLGEWIFRTCSLSWLDGGAASLFYGILQVLIWLPLLWIFYSRRLYFRI